MTSCNLLVLNGFCRLSISTYLSIYLHLNYSTIFTHRLMSSGI